MDSVMPAPAAEAKPALPILDIQRVTKRFAFRGEAVTALSDATLRIGKGEFVCLIGPSGCGKSTLLRMIAGFETPSEGTLSMWGAKVGGPGPATCLPAISSVPSDGVSKPPTMRSRVDLPQPEGPTTTTSSPSAISQETPWITSMSP